MINEAIAKHTALITVIEIVNCLSTSTRGARSKILPSIVPSP